MFVCVCVCVLETICALSYLKNRLSFGFVSCLVTMYFMDFFKVQLYFWTNVSEIWNPLEKMSTSDLFWSNFNCLLFHSISLSLYLLALYSMYLQQVPAFWATAVTGTIVCRRLSTKWQTALSQHITANFSSDNFQTRWKGIYLVFFYKKCQLFI